MTGRRFNLEDRWNYVVQTVKNATYIDYISQEYDKGDPSELRNIHVDKECYNCGKQGHIRKDCRSRSKVVQHSTYRSGSETSRT